MRSPHRLFPLMLVSLSLALGCGGSTDTPTDKGPTDKGPTDKGPTGKSATLGTASGAGDGATEGGVVHVYTHRHYDVDKQLFETFTKQTGIKVEVHKDKASALLKKLGQEGAKSPADVLITVDAGRLVQAQAKGLLQPIRSEELEKAVPANLRDAAGHWFALTVRARIIAYHKGRVKPDAIKTYAELADPKWKGKVLIRQSNNIYNQSLLASRIAHDGEEKAKAWAAGVLANVARPPKGNDRDQVKAVAGGTGDLAVVNTYYIGKLLASSDGAEKEAGAAVGVIFPDQDGNGAHINISGAGVTKHADNATGARKLIEFLVSEEAQKVFAHANYEYPVRAGIEPAELLKSWGQFKRDSLPVAKLGELNSKAQELFEAVDWP